METTKLKTVDYEFEGRKYRLECNMNVIAYVQDEYDGNLLQALDRVRGIKSTLAFLAGMLTDAADSQGIKDENGLPIGVQFYAPILKEEVALNVAHHLEKAL